MEINYSVQTNVEMKVEQLAVHTLAFIIMLR